MNCITAISRVYSERNIGTEIFVALPKDLNDYNDTEIDFEQKKGAGVQLEALDNSVESTVSFPLTEPANTPVADTVNKEHVLIVEDNDELRAFLKEVLEKKYTVYEAINGKEGFDLAVRNNPDLIISDVMMPVMSGVEFCRKIRQTFETSHIPFLFLSAKDALEAQLEGMGSGADFYISKPVSIDLLTLTIANLFEQNRKLKLKYTEDYYAEASELVHSEQDKEFIGKLIKLIEDHIANPDLDVDFICSNIYTSRSSLYKKIKAISGQSINEFIRTVRLKKAAYILTHEDITQNELVDRIGILSVSYFQKAFKKEFGKTPTQFLQSLNK
ncbi:response regulator [Mucilaginibacter sp. UC70_90]